MAALTDAAELNLLKAVLDNIAWATITAPGGSATLHLALCKGDPGEGGDMVGSEINLGEYGEYGRVAITRASDWKDNGSNGRDNSVIHAFTQMATGAGVTASHFAICHAGAIGVDDAIIYGNLTVPLAISNGITPQFAIGDLDVNAD